jgi:hypothetical protein
MKISVRKLLLGLLLAASAFVFSGCHTNDDVENASARPWNSPRSWENGLPAVMTEGR